MSFEFLKDAGSLLKINPSNAFGQVQSTANNYLSGLTGSIPNLGTLVNSATSITNNGTIPFNGGADTSNNSSVTSGYVPSTSSSPIVNPSVSRDLNEISAYAPNGSEGAYDIIYYPQSLLDTTGVLGTRYPHAMAIFMNVNSKSKLGKYMKDNPNYAAAKRLDGSDLSLADNAASQGLATNTSASGVSNFLGSAGFAAKFKRFTGCIMLPIPLNVQATYSASYGKGSADGLLGTALNTAMNGASASEGFATAAWKEGVGFLRDIGKGAVTNVAKKLSNNTDAGGVTNTKGLFDKTVGVIRNPRTEQVFEKINMREWRFQWQINISTVKEWNTVRNIASLLKENMHPELDITEAGTFMVMPNEFDIEFHEKVNGTFSESKSLPKIATCALKCFTVSYTPNGHWVSYEGTMIPPFATIEAQFDEMEPLHRGMVRDIGDNSSTAEHSSGRFTASDIDFGDKRRGF